MRELELLSPAADRNVAIQAILHGADAVYMGGPAFGARKKAANSLEDIREVVDFAHNFRVKVYVTVNTIVYEHELREVENLCRELYKIGVDALIVQDMALLELDLPPIALHASTQCDTRTPSKARFLQDVGFSQIVLARELSLKEIREIHDRVKVPLESFVHGALCVSYSGRCSASHEALKRSANRGECAQMCRLPYTLRNGRGEVLEKDKYLLSLRDFNAYSRLEQLIDAGVSSFKIEGRLKDDAYVRNVTAAYRQAIDRIIEKFPDKYRRSSFGASEIAFRPDLSKSFNRGFTDYFLSGRKKKSMASLRTPKSMGEVIGDVTELNNGDGISFFDLNGQYTGVNVNRVEGGRIISSKPFSLPAGAEIHRTFDRKWTSMLQGETAKRKIKVKVIIDDISVSAADERGLRVALPLDVDKSEARKPMDPRPIFAKLGNTVYELEEFESRLSPDIFIPVSQLTALRRELFALLDKANEAVYPFAYRGNEDESARYPEEQLDARGNVANSRAEKFYRRHGVKKIEKAVEVSQSASGREVMTTRYCLRRELGCCLKDKDVPESKRKRFQGPLTISSGPHKYHLEFDCRRCEMRVIS